MKKTTYLAWVKSFSLNCDQAQKGGCNWMLHDNYRGLACIERRYDENNRFTDHLVGFVLDGIYTPAAIEVPFPKGNFCYQIKSWGAVSGDVWVETGKDEPKELNPYEQLRAMGYNHTETTAIINRQF